MASPPDNNPGNQEFAVAARSAPRLGPPAPDGIAPDDEHIAPPPPVHRRRKKILTRRTRRHLLSLGMVFAVAAGTAVAANRSVAPRGGIAAPSHRDFRIPQPLEIVAAPAADQTTRILGAIDGKRARTHPARARRAVHVAIAVEREPASPTASAAGQTQATGSDSEPPRAGKGKRDPANDPGSTGGKEPDTALPAQPTVALNHFVNPRTGEHLYSTGDSAPSGYEWRGTEGRIFTSAAPDTKELRDEQGVVGFVYASSQDDTTPLYHCYSDGDHLFTIRQETAAMAMNDRWSCSGVVGYVRV